LATLAAVAAAWAVFAAALAFSAAFAKSCSDKIVEISGGTMLESEAAATGFRDILSAGGLVFADGLELALPRKYPCASDKVNAVLAAHGLVLSLALTKR
jgi:hypothetical protein